MLLLVDRSVFSPNSYITFLECNSPLTYEILLHNMYNLCTKNKIEFHSFDVALLCIYNKMINKFQSINQLFTKLIPLIFNCNNLNGISHIPIIIWNQDFYIPSSRPCQIYTLCVIWTQTETIIASKVFFEQFVHIANTNKFD